MPTIFQAVIRFLGECHEVEYDAGQEMRAAIAVGGLLYDGKISEHDARQAIRSLAQQEIRRTGYAFN